MMFDALLHQPPDPLLALIKQFGQDSRPGKIDLGVGTYRDEQGGTPVMRAIKAAERLLLEEQDTKGYLGPEGDLRFVELLRPIAFGAAEKFGHRMVGVQTPGGSGALRLGAELLALARPEATVWLGTPGWGNHRPVMEAAGLRVAEYRHLEIGTQSPCFSAMTRALSQAVPGDVVLLQACCHNPTGADLDAAQWDEVARILAERHLVPFLDLAYQGLGAGLETDAGGVRQVFARVDEALLAYSCDKNFGLYRDRTGALFALGHDSKAAALVFSNMGVLARVNWAMPPDHGAAAVRCVLERAELREMWLDELDGMCRRIRAVRHRLAELDVELSFLAHQNGMFAQLDLPPAAVTALQHDHAIFIAGSGRINLAGLRLSDAERFAAALRAVRAVDI